MKSNEKDPKQQAKNAKGGKGDTQQNPPAEHKPHAHVSQGHADGEKSATTSSKEPTLRGSTTDSSRTHKNPHDDMPTGGNIR